MAENTIVGKIPDFATDETEEGKKDAVVSGTEEVKEIPAEETGIVEKETPAEPPAESLERELKPAEEIETISVSDDAGNLTRQVQGLQEEREKLLREIQGLRGSRREVRQQEVTRIEQKIDDLKDLNPEDVSTLERILKSKGYVTKEESSKMLYDAVKNEETTKFLEKFPEYKPENDPNDLNWNALNRAFYWPDGSKKIAMPNDPHLIGEVLLQAHRGLAKAPSDRNIETKKQQIKIASSGSSGIQRSSSVKSLSSEQKDSYRQGGWSEEEIKKIEQNLPE